jgi:TP901 family phage tail tape measure protein
MTETIASLQAIIGADLRGFNSGMASVENSLDKTAGNLTKLGSGISTIMAPAALAFGASTKMALDFSGMITNISAVTGTTGKDLDKLSGQIMKFGEDSEYGAQQVAGAFYDIAGGVVDVKSRMAVLDAAVHTAQAGQADLGGTTKALITVMNGYGFSAKQASFASDVLTRTVGMGVGTMDDFASAFPQVTGLANSLGIGFDDLGADMAFLTTKGNSASESATQLSSAMVALLKPHDKMKKALKAIGYETGQAAIKNLGLVGTYRALLKAGYGNDMADMVGRVEALRAVTSFSDDSSVQFFTDFKKGVKGATSEAEKIQLSGPAAQVKLFESSVQSLGINLGNSMLPALQQVLGDVKPLVQGLSDWIAKNPVLVGQIGEVVALLTGAGGLTIAAGQVVSAVAGIGGAIVGLAPFILPLGIIVGMIGAYQTNFGGFRDFVDDLGKKLRALGPAGGIAVLALLPVGAYITKLVATTVVTKLATGVTALGTSFLGLATPIFVVLSPLILIGGLFWAYQNNVLGFRTEVDKLGASLRDLAKALGLVQDRGTLPGGQTFLEKLIPGFKNPFVTDQATPGVGYVQSKPVGQMPSSTNGFIPLPPGPGQTSSQPLSKNVPVHANAYAHLAFGGSVRKGRDYVVGDGGEPELFSPGANGYVTPFHAAFAGAGNGRSGPDMIKVVLQAEDFVDYVMVKVGEAM